MSLFSRLRARPELGSWILGRADESNKVRRLRVRFLLTTSIIVSNAIGIAVAIVLVFFVLPGPSVFESRFLVPTAIITPAYVAFAFLIGIIWLSIAGTRWLEWTRSERPPTPREQRICLSIPWRLTALQLLLWLGGAIVLTISYGVIEPEIIPKIGITIVLSGIVVCCAAFLRTEFGLRPVAALALELGDVRRVKLVGVRTRVQMVWLLGSGVPVLGLIFVAMFALINEDTTIVELAVSVLVLGSTSLVVGLLLLTFMVSSLVAPLKAVRWAMADLASGNLDSRVVVYDGTELGELQRGFNRMAGDVQSRARLRDLFGRHVGREIARVAEEQDPTLGGRTTNVGILFVDIIGSTEMAAKNDAQEVVDVLNRFFDVVVEAVERHGGVVNKFQGDASLAVFGAPVALEDPAASALACGRELAAELPRRIREVQAGIGVSYGPAVAGYIGSRDRFEYTVIGDSVNEAARLCELAKSEANLLLGSATAVNEAGDDEPGHWELGEDVSLRGRTESTTLARAAAEITPPAEV